MTVGNRLSCATETWSDTRSCRASDLRGTDGRTPSLAGSIGLDCVGGFLGFKVAALGFIASGFIALVLVVD